MPHQGGRVYTRKKWNAEDCQSLPETTKVSTHAAGEVQAPCTAGEVHAPRAAGKVNAPRAADVVQAPRAAGEVHLPYNKRTQLIPPGGGPRPNQSRGQYYHPSGLRQGHQEALPSWGTVVKKLSPAGKR